MSEIAAEVVSLLKSKGIKPSPVSEPDYSKFQDQEMPFLHGFSFVYPKSEYCLRAFLGLYQCSTRVFGLVSIQNYFPLHKIAQSQTSEFYDWMNAKNSLCHSVHVAAATNHIRFYLGSFLPQSALRESLWLLVETTVQKYETTMRDFTTWARTELAYRLMHEHYTREMAFFTLAGGFARASNVGWLLEAGMKAAFDLKAQKPNCIETFGWCVYQCKVINEKSEASGLPARVPITISIGPAMFTIEQFVLARDVAREFNPDECKYLPRLVAEVNRQLSVGFFEFKEVKKQLVLKVQCPYALIERAKWRECVRSAAELCVNTFAETVPGMLRRLEGNVQESLSEDQSEDDIDFDLGDAAEGSYSTDSEDDPEQDSSQSTLPSDRAPLSMLFEEIQFTDFERIPVAARRFFVMSSEQHNRLKPVLWIREWKVENACECVKDAFRDLAKLGVAFKRIPFDACGFAQDDRSVVLLPKFPPKDLILNQAFDSDAFDRQFATEIVEHLMSALMNNPYTMEAFSLYSSLESPSLISVSQLKNQKLKSHCIGKGGFGQVYYNMMANCPVAIKLVSWKQRSSEEHLRKAFMQELHLQQACPHPSIVRAFGYFKTDDAFALVTEYCSGGTLKKYVQERVLTIQQKVKMVREVAEGIVFMHGKNICHFDLKPTNVLISEDGRAKICDFGLAKQLKENRYYKKTGLTMNYAAPEQIKRLECSQATDMWSFALIAMYVLLNVTLFNFTDHCPNRAEKAMQAIKEKLPQLPIGDRFRKNNPLLVNLLQSCLQIEPERRPSAIDVLKILRTAEASARD